MVELGRSDTTMQLIGCKALPKSIQSHQHHTHEESERDLQSTTVVQNNRKQETEVNSGGNGIKGGGQVACYKMWYARRWSCGAAKWGAIGDNPQLFRLCIEGTGNGDAVPVVEAEPRNGDEVVFESRTRLG